MQNINQKFVILPLALLIAFSPTLSYAKENERKEERGEKKEQVHKDENDNDKESRKDRKSCVKAFGHLISPGYMKNKGEVDIDFWKDCVIPFGIMKKFNRNATTTPGLNASSTPHFKIRWHEKGGNATSSATFTAITH